MTPDEFLRAIAQRPPAPVYLFVGPETWSRDRCRRGLLDRVLPAEDRDEGFTRHDLAEVELSTVLDDARSLSLFASNRLVWVTSAEAALPRGRAAAAAEEEEEESRSSGKQDGAALLENYIKDPVPGVVMVFDSSRYDFEGDDKAKLQRVQKFYSAAAQVEFAAFSREQARRLAHAAARERNLGIGEGELDLLVEVLASKPLRIVNEIEKLSLYAGQERRVTPEDIWQLVPSAKASTIFSLVNAIARSDRPASLDSLDVLIREGEYLPLALSFLGTQFRLALVAKEARLTNANQVQSFFTRQGTPMWRSRAESVAQTAAASTHSRLLAAVAKLYETDKALRDTRPDDRTVMEQLVLELTN
jgi:DNA polymerase III subunit delta